MPLIAILLIAAAYTLGSVPFALVIGRGLYHTDVREYGSGNLGTTNVFRVLGKVPGTIVFICDMGKGFLPTFLAAHTGLIEADNAALVAVLVAGAAIAGHTFSMFLCFRGGKGVATGGGAILALMPLLFVLAFAVFWAALLASRIVSVASLSAVFFLCVAVIVRGEPLPYIVFTLLAGAVILYAHRSNIKRLARGKENRVTFPWNRSVS